MLFSSSVFLFCFLPIVIFLYYTVCAKSIVLKNILLTVASLFFYAWGEPRFVVIMLLSITANWLFGFLADKGRTNPAWKRFAIGLAAVFNIGIMFIFKYLCFTLETVKSVFHADFSVPQIALPIGISFFTFQAFSYVIDVSRGDGKVQKNPMNVALYISFFPQLIAGPIVRYQTVAEEIKFRKETLNDFSSGAVRFMIGFIKKVLLANTVAVIADKAFDSTEPISVAFAWLGAICYTLQIYYDFSGYSDMAIGLGRMFGFHFLENFDYPYTSKSISEFWRRWHISLGTWFRDYVYFPLGGSRVKTKSRLIFNLFVVWMLTGIWHGANWTFLLWGFLYFILIAFEKLTGFDKKLRKASVVKYLYTMFFVVAGWVLFRAESLSAAGTYYLSLLGLNSNALFDSQFILFFTNNWIFILAAVVFSFPAAKWAREKLGNHTVCKAVYAVGLLILFFVSVCYIVKGSYNPFIYFNF